MSSTEISRRQFLSQAAGATAALALGQTALSSHAETDPTLLTKGRSLRQPNLVFILTDDLGWADLSSYGRSDYQTRSLDSLAKQGVLLTQAYANSAVCSPTRVAFLTGRYQQRLPVGLLEAGVMKMGEKAEDFSIRTVVIFVPGVVRRSAAFYSCGEIFAWEVTGYGRREREELHESATEAGQIL